MLSDPPKPDRSRFSGWRPAYRWRSATSTLIESMPKPARSTTHSSVHLPRGAFAPASKVARQAADRKTPRRCIRPTSCFNSANRVRAWNMHRFVSGTTRRWRKYTAWGWPDPHPIATAPPTDHQTKATTNSR